MPTKYFPIYFSPDHDPDWNINPGLLLDVTDYIPTKRNTIKNYAASDVQDYGGGGTFDSGTFGKPLFGKVMKKIDGTARLIVGTKGRLMEHTGAAWTDRSVGGNYSASTTDWTFTTFGNDIIACNYLNSTQISTGAAFANLGGTPPKAQLCCTQLGFVMLANYDDGVNQYGDGWWCSALFNDASWTPSLATQAANGRLVDTPGKITALVPLRDSIVAYKEDSIYVGDYIGNTTTGIIWAWRLISDRVGCAAPNGVAIIDGVHYFLHRSGMYRCDGSYPVNIGDGINQYIVSKYGNQSKFSTTQAVFDEYEGVALWYFTSSSAAANQRDHAIAYNKWTGKFGYISSAWYTGTGTCNAVVQATLSDLTQWASSLGTSATEIMTVGAGIGGSTTINLRLCAFGVSTAGGSSSILTGHFGDDQLVTTLTRCKPRALIMDGSSSSTFTDYCKMSESDTPDAGTVFTTTPAQKRFDGTRSSRWHKMGIAFPNASEIAGLQLTFSQAGSE